jgi:transposase
VPEWGAVDRELRRKGVTRALLWEEYRATCPEGYGYAWFCEHYEAWKGRVRPTSHRRCASGAGRQTHVGGGKVFIDFSGDGVEVVGPLTGEVTVARLFVAASRQRRAFGTMGASSYTYAEARPAETLEDWIGAQVNLFAFLGGVPRMVVPDNPRAVIVAPDRHEPGLNRTMAAMAEHYGVAVLPARPRRPRDKAKAEAAVLVAQRWIVVSQTRLRHDARLRNRRFFSIEEARRRDPAAGGRDQHPHHARLRGEPCRPLRHHRHQPAARRHLARRHRRPDPRRRHPRQARPQCPSPRTGRREHAKDRRPPQNLAASQTPDPLNPSAKTHAHDHGTAAHDALEHAPTIAWNSCPRSLECAVGVVGLLIHPGYHAGFAG